MEPGVKHYMLNNKEEVNKLPIRPGQLITSRENQILLDMDDGRRHPLGVQMGTQDLIDGESDLATGVLYVVMGEGGGSAGGGGGAAPTIKVDSELSNTSTNPVQNKAIASEIDYIYYKLNKLEPVEVDTSLSESSKNPVQNRVITSEINTIYNKIDNLKVIDVDSELSESSVNPVQNQAITKKLNEVFQSVSDGKEMISSAITDQGVKTDSDATFEDMAEHILQIQSGTIDKVVPLIPRAMTSNQQEDVTVTASNNQIGNEPFHAFRQFCSFDTENSFWVSEDGGTAWLEVAFKDNVMVSNYRLSTFSSIETNLQYYSTGSNKWKDCNSKFVAPGDLSIVAHTHDVSLYKMIKAKKFRFCFYNSSNSNIYQIGNCQLYGIKELPKHKRKPELEFYTAGEALITLSGRVYYKRTNDFAIGGWAHDHGWYGPWLISKNPEGTAYTGGNANDTFSFEYENEIWFCSTGYYAYTGINPELVSGGRALYLNNIEYIKERLTDNNILSDITAVLDYYFYG